MTISYDILVRVTVNHAYYVDNLSADFEFLPTPSTQSILKRFNLIFKPLNHGFVILARIIPGSNPPELLQAADLDNYKLSFLMVPKDPHVLNFTLFQGNQPPHPGQSALYFSNVDQAGGSAPTLGASFPNLGGGITVDNYPQLATRNTYNLLFDTPVNSATPVLRDLFDITYSPTPVVSLPPTTPTQSLQFKLN